MICPNCFGEMKCRRETRYEPCFGGFVDAEDYDEEDDESAEYTHELHRCSSCKISYEKDIYTGSKGRWHIPEKYNPTYKQARTILFINNRLHLGLEPLTKRQCWSDINEHFEEAKNTPLHTDEDYLELQELYGMDYGDFC